MKLSAIKNSIDIYLNLLKIDKVSLCTTSFKNFFNNNLFKQKSDIQMLLEFYENLPKTINHDNSIKDRDLKAEELYQLMLILLQEKTSSGTPEKNVFNRIKYADFKLMKKCINEYNAEQGLSFEKFQIIIQESRKDKISSIFTNKSATSERVLPEIRHEVNIQKSSWSISSLWKNTQDKLSEIELPKLYSHDASSPLLKKR